MIDLEKVKMVLWDFDDTLCIHTRHTSAKDEFDTEFNVKVLRGDDPYVNCIVNEDLVSILRDIAKRGIRQGLISATRCYIHAKNKATWVREMYGVPFDNYCVGDFRMKCGIMIAIAQANGWQHDEILIVDDYYKNVTEAADCGFQSATPLEMIAAYKKFQASEHDKSN